MKLLSDGIPDAFSSSDTNPEAIPKAIPKAIPDHSHRSTLHQEGWLRQLFCEAIGECLSSQYLAQVDLSIPSDICSTIELGRNVRNCSSAEDSVIDARD
jgi:hypothetical protein